MANLKEKSKVKRKVAPAAAYSILTHFGRNNITEKTCESEGPDGTTARQFFTTENFFIYNTGKILIQKRIPIPYACNVGATLGCLMNWKIMSSPGIQIHTLLR